MKFKQLTLDEAIKLASMCTNAEVYIKVLSTVPMEKVTLSGILINKERYSSPYSVEKNDGRSEWVSEIFIPIPPVKRIMTRHEILQWIATYGYKGYVVKGRDEGEWNMPNALVYRYDPSEYVYATICKDLSGKIVIGEPQQFLTNDNGDDDEA